MRWALFLVALLFAGSLLAAECRARSPETTVALVELYTSEGCDSCPSADRWLSTLAGRGFGPERLVPLALHVDYWDYIGWKDPYAQSRFSSRQRKLAQLTRSAIVFTPQVVLQGRDFRGWAGPAFEQAVQRINARPARARIELGLDTRGKGAFRVDVAAEILEPSQRAEAALYLASYENKLLSRVQAGENRGKTLAHDFVVFEWVGPLEFKGASRLAESRTLPLLPSARAAHSGVVAFVQNRASTEVLQAVLLPACPG